AIETLGKGTDSFYQALSTALRDQDPAVFRKAVSMMISHRDPRSMEMITARLTYTSRSKIDGHLMTVLAIIRKSGAKELIPVLAKLRRQLMLRFWQWNRTRALYKAVNDTIREIQREKRTDA
ncbi:MAG TPA: hypothetical protein VLY20_03715, partial [Nitrospiria bacterium]|nr:hypothetical protein [Nitrospiria bacterium]